MQTVRKLMTHKVETISADATLQEAADKMKACDIGALPVVDGHTLKGMVTDRDIVIRSVARTDHADELRVKDVMSPKMVCGYEDQTIEEAAKIMQKEHTRRLPIVNSDQRLVGMLSLGDLAQENKDLTAKTLRSITKNGRYMGKFKLWMGPRTFLTSAAAVGLLASAGAYLLRRRGRSH